MSDKNEQEYKIICLVQDIIDIKLKYDILKKTYENICTQDPSLGKNAIEEIMGATERNKWIRGRLVIEKTVTETKNELSECKKSLVGQITKSINMIDDKYFYEALSFDGYEHIVIKITITINNESSSFAEYTCNIEMIRGLIEDYNITI